MFNMCSGVVCVTRRESVAIQAAARWHRAGGQLA